MDDALNRRCIKIQNIIDELKTIEERFLNLDASKKTLHAQLYLQAEGKTSTEREAKAYANQEWINFCTVLASEESNYNRTKRMLDLQLKAFDADYLSLKLEHSAIRRQP